MNIQDAIEIGSAAAISLGGGTLVVFSFSSWLGKVWAGRILETEKKTLQRELERHKSELSLQNEKLKSKFLRYSESQFKTYNELWSSLCELEATCESLWNDANFDMVVRLGRDLAAAKMALRKSSILMEESHYNSLFTLFSRFSEFQFGKIRLLEIRKNIQEKSQISTADISFVVQGNANLKDEYMRLMEQIRLSFRAQIHG
jgi:hypothetical protein